MAASGSGAVLNEDDDEEYWVKEYISNTNAEADDRDAEEFLQILLEKEIKFDKNPIQTWVSLARKDGIQWIINTRPKFKFRFQTAYLSVTYIDRYLSSKLIADNRRWVVPLLWLACMSLAAKFQESQIVKLPQFKIGSYDFGADHIHRMELDVLTTLEWRMDSVTPFDFIHYFVPKCCKERPKREVVVATIQAVFRTIKDRDFMLHRPSVIAIAATLFAMDRTLTRQSLEIRMKEISLIQLFDIKDVYACYDRMLQIQPKTSLDVSSSFGQPSVYTAPRRRLTFPKDDQQNQEKRSRW